MSPRDHLAPGGVPRGRPAPSGWAALLLLIAVLCSTLVGMAGELVGSGSMIRPLNSWAGGPPPDPPPESDYPDQNNTGLASWRNQSFASLDLSNSTFTGGIYTGLTTFSTPGQIIENAKFQRQITLAASNITVRGCWFTGNDFYDIVASGSLQGIHIEDCWFQIGSVGTDSNVGYVHSSSGANMTQILRCNMMGKEDAVKAGNNNLIQDCFLHDFAVAPPTTHNDGVQILSATNVRVRHCTLHVIDGWTSGVMLVADTGNTSNVELSDSLILLTGGSQANWGAYFYAYGGTLTGDRICKNNRWGAWFATSGRAVTRNVSLTDGTGNVRDDNDAPMSV